VKEVLPMTGLLMNLINILANMVNNMLNTWRNKKATEILISKEAPDKVEAGAKAETDLRAKEDLKMNYNNCIPITCKNLKVESIQPKKAKILKTKMWIKANKLFCILWATFQGTLLEQNTAKIEMREIHHNHIKLEDNILWIGARHKMMFNTVKSNLLTWSQQNNTSFRTKVQTSTLDRMPKAKWQRREFILSSLLGNRS